MQTSWQTSDIRLAVKSVSHDGEAPLRALEPQAQVDGAREGCQPYRRAIASPLWSVKPNSSSGSEVSQLEDPFSCARSIAR